MDNREKLIKAGEMIFGSQWQSPMARLLGVDSRAVRRYVAGNSRAPMTYRLVDSLKQKKQEIDEAITLVESDLISGDCVTPELIESIVSRYTYENDDHRQLAVDAIKKSIYEMVYLSDLNQIAKKYSSQQ
ncbi:hypothetical protein AB204_02475 [Xenorhabdus khoisanae]|uniref:Phage protein n=1 Tax=Xenorhabdus khoisanae TaxID=880157 RepID=A0A0J5FWW5_9GAMM|nr:hypothetical protein [Xenorhabdus khoisanae]KMJ46701.1 hypothetical protein AB204_02475 [Xenorhabdus khoisanae]